MLTNSTPLPQLSLAKDKIRILLLEGISDTAVNLIVNAGYTNVERLTKALSGDALLEAAQRIEALGHRLLAQADRLRAEAATKKEEVPA